MTNAEMKELDEQLWGDTKPKLLGKYDTKYTWRVHLEAEPITVHVNADNADEALERAQEYCSSKETTDITHKLTAISANIIGVTEFYRDRSNIKINKYGETITMTNDEEIEKLEKRLKELKSQFGPHGEALE